MAESDVDDILYGFAEECGVINKDISEAKQAIVTYLESVVGEIIGEDENFKVSNVNRRLAKQRKKLAEIVNNIRG